MSIRQKINDILQRHIVVADAAVGTALIGTRRDLCADELSITDHERVVALHEAAIRAGARIITTNTFLSDSLSLVASGATHATEEVVAKSVAAAKQARESVAKEATAAGKTPKEVFIAGSIGPSVRNISLATDISEEALRESYRALIKALSAEGVDIFLIESITDIRNAEIAAEECRAIAPETPIIFSAVLSKIGGLLLSGRTIEKYVEDVEKFDPIAIGFNCSTGVQSVVDNLSLLVRYTKRHTYCSPSAGIPNAKGEYPESAKRHTEALRKAAESGLLSIVGGCCGTTEKHTLGVAQMARHSKPRKTE